MRATLIVSIFMFLSACALTNQSQDDTSSWRGKSADLLLKQKGVPNTIMPAGNGNTLFMYTIQTKENYPTTMSNPTIIAGPKGTAIAANVPSSEENTSYMVTKCSTTYEVNKQHMIVAVSSSGACQR